MTDIIIYRKYRVKNEKNKYKGQTFLRQQGAKDVEYLEDEWAKIDEGTSKPKPKNLWEQFKADAYYAVTGKR